MRLGVFSPVQMPKSVRAYSENVAQELRARDVIVVRFSESDELPDAVDLYWDPRVAGGVAPYRGFQSVRTPLVITVHGAAPFAASAREFFPNWQSAVVGKIQNLKILYEWRAFRDRCAAIITVSGYAKAEIEKHLGLCGAKITPIHHGVNHGVFSPGVSVPPPTSYLLHVSMYQPLKNVDRIIAAYGQLRVSNKPRLVAVVPGCPHSFGESGVDLIRTTMSHEKLVSLYRDAIGLVFPSLRESFGMPILEAMASGCPVITSNATACVEVAEEAALLVNPRSVDEIANAMARLINDHTLRGTLKAKGIERAREFTWRKSAEAHLSVFREVLGDLR